MYHALKSTEVKGGPKQKMKGTELTERQSQVLDIVRQHIQRRGVPPSRTELATEMGLANTSAVDGHLNALAKKGWVELLPSVERGIRLLREGTPIFDADDLPSITAGSPAIMEEHKDYQRVHDLDSVIRQFEAKPDFFLRVQGDSLDKAGLSTGDIVAVLRQPEAHNGDIVVARIGREITLKRFQRTGSDSVALQQESQNTEHKTIRIGPDTVDFEIVGIVVGAIVKTTRKAQEQSEDTTK